MIIHLPLLVSLLGLLVYGLTNGKAAQAGLVAFGVGLLVYLDSVAHGLVHLP